MIGVTHHGNNALEPYQAQGFLCWWERARDLTVALDRLSGSGPLAAHLDLDRVYAAGFSLGGYTVLSLAGAITDMSLFQAWLAEHPEHGAGPHEFPGAGKHWVELLGTSPEFVRSVARMGQDYRDPRVRALLAIAPAPPVRAFVPESLQAIALPVALVCGEADREAPFGECAAWVHA